MCFDSTQNGGKIQKEHVKPNNLSRKEWKIIRVWGQNLVQEAKNWGSYPSRTRVYKLEAFFKPIKALAETQLTNIRKFDSDYLICFTHNGLSCLYFYGHNHEKERWRLSSFKIHLEHQLSLIHSTKVNITLLDPFFFLLLI